MTKLYDELHGLYSLSKTLRFELQPIGKTKENIMKDGIIIEDEHRAETYKRVKKYCDEYHKKFIDESLKNTKLQQLEEYMYWYKKEKRLPEQEKIFDSIKDDLCKQITNSFKNNKNFEGLFNKNLITSYLVDMFENDKCKLNDINEFKKFTTYFTGFNNNRKNMYSGEEKATAIAYRLINENLPTFINNIIIFQKVINNIPDLFDKVNQELYEYMPVKNLNDMFDINFYNELLTESGIETYNIIISGLAENNKKKIKGINEIINEFNQKNNTKLPKLKELYKQILSDKTSTSFQYDIINNDLELLSLIEEYYANNLNNKFAKTKEIYHNIENYNLDKIYINAGSNINNMSKSIFGEWDFINDALSENYNKNYKGKNKINTEKYYKEKASYFKNKKFYSIQELEVVLNSLKIREYFKNYLNENNVIENIKEKYIKFNTINKEQNETRIFNEQNIFIVKDLLDNIKKLQEFMKILIPKDNTVFKDDEFYSDLINIYQNIEEIIPLYNKARNYLTKKAYSTEKVKINFECSTLLNGWDVNKEKDNLGVIFLKDNSYYLGIINSMYKKIFIKPNEDKNGDNYQKMEYKLLPGPNKMFPKVFFSTKGLEKFKPAQEILDIYNSKTFKKSEHFNLESCHKLIDFYKWAINNHDDWKNFKFNFKETSKYNDIGEFFHDVENQGYKLDYTNWSTQYIDSLVETGQLYLFKIYNKDFSKYSKGMPNLHTLYWKMIFNEENLKRGIYKLNGEAEIFYRKSSLKYDKPTHLANQPINNKNKYTIEHGKATSIFEYDLIKDKRYTLDKFQFHVPISLNFVNKGQKYINGIVNKYLKYNSEKVYVIGIDRGERNLLYYSVVDSTGNIVEQDSLNIIKNKYKDMNYETDYHDLLDSREKERDKARKSWSTIENIKELKEGYMSQVINKIANLLIKYPGVIVIEDLNSGFKNSRVKVEKQVYQKFEKMLIDKLNYLVYKNRPATSEGGLLNAYQLTNKFVSFQKMGKQSGILFYIPAWNTSKIDPTTGFVNLFHIKNQSLEKSKEFLSLIDDIRYNKIENYFEFDIDYRKFTEQLNDSKTNWTLCSYGDRIRTFRNKEKNNEWDNKNIILTNEFKNLFIKYNINLDNIKEEILKKSDSKFYNAILEEDGYMGFNTLFKLLVQMRNSITNSFEDYLISPIKNKNRVFFDSRKSDNTLPKNADANGAYNIARKGLMLINQIKVIDDDKLDKIKYDLTNKEWLKYAQKMDN